MGISKNYQKAIEICDEFQEFTILEYIKGKSPKIKIQCNNCGEQFERYITHFVNYPHICPKCHPKGSNQKVTLEEAQNRINEVYGFNKFKLLEYKGNNTKTKVQCLMCDEIFESVPASLWRGRVKGCPYCEKSISLGESRLEKFFRENNIQYRTQERFNDCRDQLALPFDFYLPQYNICVEFQGEQHYKQRSLYWSELAIQHDKIKEEYCKDKNIKLIKIPYWDIDNIPSYFKFIQK